VSGITVQHAGQRYPIIVRPGELARLDAAIERFAPGRRAFVIGDATVLAAHPELLPQVPRFAPPPGEAGKTRATWQELTDQLLEAGADRQAVIVALGGGVTTDLAGFVAATFLRGVPWIAVPTTTLAMCDAAIGGKTGVDTAQGKNLVGAFHQPLAVIADPEVLSTLPDTIYRAGLAEAIKHAAIHDVGHWRWLADQAAEILARDPSAVTCLIADSARIKATIVNDDERESGRRAILNAGHTIAHAIEQATDYAIPHGHAVAHGLLLETRIGEALGRTAPGTSAQVEALLHRFALPILLPATVDRDRMLAAMQRDKKNRDGAIHAALLAQIGRVAGSDARGWTTPLPVPAITAVL
jgi:3-dehydroquinate synthase